MATPTPPDTQEPLAPASLIGRDELNLAEFPIALLADYAPRGRKTIHFEDKHGRLTVTGGDAYGLPTALDSDVIVALIYLTKLRNDFGDGKVYFSRYELIKLLNWPEKGSSYSRLDQALNRWSGVSLIYDNCWWNNRLKTYTSAKMHIIETVEIIDNDARKSRQGGQMGLPFSYFIWNRTFIESCQADNLRLLDLETYFSLESSISKRLYRFLGKRFYLQRDWTFDLHEIAFDRVGLSRGYERNAGKIKEKLQPALDELEAIGFLRPLNRDDRYHRVDRGRWTIRLTRQSPILAAPPPPASPETGREPAAPPLVNELVNRGVTPKTAAELIERRPAETIQAKLDVFDWLTEKQDKRVAKSPAGYLVKSIADDYAPPKGFISKAERQRQEDARRAEERQAAEDRRRRNEEEARERADKEAIAAYWESLTPERQAELDAAADAAAAPELMAMEDGPLRRLGRRLRRDGYIRQLLKDREPVPADS